jgi:putative membrane protein
MFFFPGLIILLLIVLFIGRPWHRGHWHGDWSDWSVGQRPGNPGRTDAALGILDERYARGEIGREDYLQRRRDLLGQ